ncbi:MAG: hypothetical protein MK135_11305, partial [Polyangiaceae bacterium]|nr:hypothetical protein [Polyangiaceae bacterium]
MNRLALHRVQLYPKGPIHHHTCSGKSIALLVDTLEEVDEWARLLSGQIAPNQGRIYWEIDGKAQQPFGDPQLRARLPTSLLNESGALLGATVEEHLKSVARLMGCQAAQLQLPQSLRYLTSRTADSLTVAEVRQLALSLALQ